MKIYNKKNFVSGMFITLLGIALIGMDLAKGWVWRDSIIHILCLALGLMLMVRSCSRTMARADRLAELDERNQLVLLKNRSRAFQIHRYSCLALAALFFCWPLYRGPRYFCMWASGLPLPLAYPCWWTSLPSSTMSAAPKGGQYG